MMKYKSTFPPSEIAPTKGPRPLSEMETRSSLEFRPRRQSQGRRSTSAERMLRTIRSFPLQVERKLFRDLEGTCRRLGLRIEPHEDDDLAWVIKTSKVP